MNSQAHFCEESVECKEAVKCFLRKFHYRFFIEADSKFPSNGAIHYSSSPSS